VQSTAAPFNAFSLSCPTRQMVAALSDKWVTLVVVALTDGPLRFSELLQRIEGVSQKMLTQTVRTLERDGFVSRTVTASVPVRVDYELTALGLELLPVLAAIKSYAEAHMPDIQVARAEYDRVAI